MTVKFLLISLGLHLMICLFGKLVSSHSGIDTSQEIKPVFVSSGHFQEKHPSANVISESLGPPPEIQKTNKMSSSIPGNWPNMDEFVFREQDIVKNGNRLPKYPQQALEQGVQGTVLLKLTLSPNGDVFQSEVVESSGSPLLDLAAFSASKTWKFKVGLDVKKIIAPIKFVIES
jgi:TonB family protein